MSRPISWIACVTAALSSVHGASMAGQFGLAQTPPGTSREPAPNIIVSVDDSGSMGSSGIETLKNALRQTFSDTSVPDDRIRLAWQSMNACPGIPYAGGTCQGRNVMKRLSGTHRSNFMTWVDSLTYKGGTPGHLMMANAGDYLMQTGLGSASPWAANPGVEEAPLLGCRKSFHIFMTDGAYNSGWTATNDAGVSYSRQLDTAGKDSTNSSDRIVRGGGNADGTSKTLPDGTSYDIASEQTRLYRDGWGKAGLSSFSDLAFHYWSIDLQPSLANQVRKSPREQFPDENFGSASSPANLKSYWNPRNNPATWQNLVTYTIGFNAAANWTGNPLWQDDTFVGLAPLIRGEAAWPSPFCGSDSNSGCDTTRYNDRENSRKTELWHAALNSRGRFIPAPNADALLSAFQNILDDILVQTANLYVSIATSSSRLRAAGLVYVAGFDSQRWSGQLSAYAIAAGSGAIATAPTWTASGLLDRSDFSVSGRLVLTSDGSTARSFEWSKLNASQQNFIKGADSGTVGSNRLNYLRGDQSQETTQGGVLRARASRLGDIVNSNLWRTGRPARLGFEHAGHAAFRSANASRPAMLYVGANDGMLHALDAASGQERLAYVPWGVYPKLREYTLPSYGHAAYVDGNSFTGDADLGGGAAPDWRTLLVGQLGAGGRGYFVLDVTRPVATGSMASTFGTTGVLMDKTFAATATASYAGYEDVGHIYARPVVDSVTGSLSEQIVKLNNKRWAVVMGNGVNSINERPVLLVQYLDGGRELLRLVADSSTGQANGLSAPRLIDVNGDGRMDIAYAGDLKGNFWKFDLSRASDGDWGVSRWGGGLPCKNAATCVPLFVAKDGAGQRQPISSAPMWMAHPLGGTQLLFGTGRNLTEADRSSNSQQTIYSILDKSRYTVSGGYVTLVDADNIPETDSRNADLMVAQAVTTQVGDTRYYQTSSNEVDYAAGRRGWYVDLPVSRERVLADPELFLGQLAIVSSYVPKAGSSANRCNLDAKTGQNWLNVINMITGKPPSQPVFADTDSRASRALFSRSEDFITLNKAGGGMDLISLNGDGMAVKESLLMRGLPGARADWREIP